MLNRDQWSARRKGWEAYNRWEASLPEPGSFAERLQWVGELFEFYRSLHGGERLVDDAVLADLSRHVFRLHAALATLSPDR